MGLNQRADDSADDGQGTGERPVPRHGRAALLRLAAWFEEAEPDRADALAGAAFALHPARHLEGRVDDSVAATTSWWRAEPDRSTVTEHPGTRLPEPVRDHRAQQARLRDAAESSAHWRRAGAEQIRSLLTEPTGDRARLDLSGAGMEVLMELLTAALGSGDASRRPTSAGDLEFGLRLHVYAAPGAEVTARGEGGDLTLEGLRLRVTSYEQHTVDTATPAGPSEIPDPSAPLEAAGPSEVPVPPEPVTGPEPLAGPSAEPLAGPSTEPPAANSAESPDTPPDDPLDGPLDGPGGTPADVLTDTPSDESGQGPEDGSTGFADSDAPAAEPEPTGTLPGSDPDVETTGPIDIVTHTPWTRRWG
ncbi:DUF2397 family protein [Nocardiopsis metallicus]|uniref:Uncharacterized protein n=1 Tax=Nocardiopsis metallicus TaxID=179819 RepID=A0A840WHK1_9ACTN|nr:DUF2397 family protein [Nocardiopsis metallicus]MBB5494943.1 hypothetical protein [Nocardiopsis metallicus]